MANMLLNRLQGEMDKSDAVVRIEKSDLQTITITSEMEELYVKDNQIEQVIIDPNGSGGSLRVLDLSENLISDVSEVIKFPALEILNLSGNNLRDTLDLGKFKGLNKLRVLDLSRNDINYLDNTGDVNLESLKDLDLSDNNLITSDLDISIFYPYTELHTLRLNNNYLSSLDYKMLPNIKSLKTIYLNGNNFPRKYLYEMRQYLQANGIETPGPRVIKISSTRPLQTKATLTTPKPTVINSTGLQTTIQSTNTPLLEGYGGTAATSILGIGVGYAASISISAVIVIVIICVIVYICMKKRNKKKKTTVTPQGGQITEDGSYFEMTPVIVHSKKPSPQEEANATEGANADTN